MLAEVRPSDAPAAIAALYADILLVSGVPVVNLIWRHLATLPGVLAWAWSAVRPLVASSEMAEARVEISERTQASLAELRLGRAKLVRLNGGDPKPVRAIINGYLFGNLTNITALTALRLRIRNQAAPSSRLTPAEQTAPVPMLPPLPSVRSLDPEIAAIVESLASQHEASAKGIVPSLYLALTPWPDLLAALAMALGPLYEPRQLHATRALIVHHSSVQATRMLPELGNPPMGYEAMLPVLSLFVDSVIPELIAVCIGLRTLLARVVP